MSYLNTNLLPFDNLDPLSFYPFPENPQKAAAVFIGITDNAEQPEILFTRRADHLNSHSGQVSFPGGRWEKEDKTLSCTALRESLEEVALAPNFVTLKGSMKPKISSNKLDVFPYVGLIPASIELVACPNEIADIFFVPLSFFKTESPSRIDLIDRHGSSARVPAWDYEGYDIWGLTAMFTLDLLTRFNLNIDLYSAPERHIA